MGGGGGGDEKRIQSVRTGSTGCRSQTGHHCSAHNLAPGESRGGKKKRVGKKERRMLARASRQCGVNRIRPANKSRLPSMEQKKGKKKERKRRKKRKGRTFG